MDNLIIRKKNNIWFATFPLFEEHGVINACSCRLHGLSDIKKGTLNLALHVGDDEKKVLHNRKLFADAIGADASKFTTCEQVHGSQIAVVSEKEIGAGAFSLAESISKTDALVTNLRQVPLLLFYADCVPILLYDAKNKVIALVHAGWRGTVAEIAAKTIRVMQERFSSNPTDILAAIGPSVGSCCYEVDYKVLNCAQGYEQFFKPVKGKHGHYLLNLWDYNAIVLQKAGILTEHLVFANICTAHNYELFFSYRAEEGKTGRMGVCLMLP